MHKIEFNLERQRLLYARGLIYPGLVRYLDEQYQAVIVSDVQVDSQTGRQRTAFYLSFPSGREATAFILKYA